jgi:parallel beta-helix repeat protein
MMIRTWVASIGVVLWLWAGMARAADISGTINTTLMITENSRLVGDVTCTVTGAPCIIVAASGVTLDLNGYTITGQADAQMGCSGVNTANEHGIQVNSVQNAIIRGLGLVQRFRAIGIQLLTSTGITVSGVTASTNCQSGILLAGGSNNLLENNTSIRNGLLGAPCGGI